MNKTIKELSCLLEWCEPATRALREAEFVLRKMLDGKGVTRNEISRAWSAVHTANESAPKEDEDS